MWWHMPVTSAIRMLKQGCSKFLASLGYFYCVSGSRGIAQPIKVFATKPEHLCSTPEPTQWRRKAIPPRCSLSATHVPKTTKWARAESHGMAEMVAPALRQGWGR